MRDVLLLLLYASACCGLYYLLALGFVRLVAFLGQKVRGTFKSVLFVMVWLVLVGIFFATVLFAIILRGPTTGSWAALRVVPLTLAAASVPALRHVLKNMQNSKDQWIALALFPFKAYVVMALPFLNICFWCKAKFQPRFYGYPQEATFAVCMGYVLCLAVLLFGGLLQVITCRRWSWIWTLVLVALGFVFYEHLWPWGMMGR